MMKIHLLICGAILISFIPVGGNQQEARIDRVTAEEYAVYSALLNEIKVSPHDGKEVKLLVINDHTEGPDKSCFPEEIDSWITEPGKKSMATDVGCLNQGRR